MNKGRIGILLATALCGGCYSFQPVEWTEVAPPMQVRARVSLAQAERLETLLPVDGRLVEGEVVGREPDELLLRVPTSTLAGGAMSRVLYQQIVLPRDGVLEVELKEIDGMRTGAAVAVGGLVAGTVMWAIIAGRSGGSTSGDPPGTVESVIPALLSIFR